MANPIPGPSSSASPALSPLPSPHPSSPSPSTRSRGMSISSSSGGMPSFARRSRARAFSFLSNHGGVSTGGVETDEELVGIPLTPRTPRTPRRASGSMSVAGGRNSRRGSGPGHAEGPQGGYGPLEPETETDDPDGAFKDASYDNALSFPSGRRGAGGSDDEDEDLEELEDGEGYGYIRHQPQGGGAYRSRFEELTPPELGWMMASTGVVVGLTVVAGVLWGLS